MQRKFGLAHVTVLVTAVLFLLWSWLTVTGALTGWDSAADAPGVAPASSWGQVLAAVAVVTTPVVQYVGLAAGAWWASRRRLHNLAWAMALAIPLSWGASWLTKFLLQRPRPATASALITAEGFGYPSAHMTAVTVLAVMVTAALILTRQQRTTLIATVALLGAAWGFIAYDRFALRAHFLSDIVGGGLLGALTASLALALAGVRVARLTDPRRVAASARDRKRQRRPAVVVNPTKVPDPIVFRRYVEGECLERGWAAPLWFETDPDDPGESATRRARDKEADLVFVAGGDGTVRAVCATMSGSDVPVAILPVGTGNLLARNLGIPLDFSDALDVAFDGTPRWIDLVEIKADDRPADSSAVMAGMGADATIMNETNEDLKKVVGSAAYVMAALSAVNRPPFTGTLAVDDAEAIDVEPGLVLIANVGQIQGQIDLAPDASPDDGLLDVLVASPKGVAEWAAIGSAMLTRSPDAPGVERVQARTVVIEASEAVPYQLDGDAVGDCRRLEATIVPGAVQVMVP